MKMNATVGESVSRVRNQLKLVKQDAFLTDRFIYSVLIKNARYFLKREDGQFKIYSQRNLFRSFNVTLEQVDSTLDVCGEVTGCEIITRTKDKVASLMMEGYYGPLILAVLSIDGTRQLVRTTPTDYITISSLSNARLNKSTGYYWEQDGYLYFPNVHWKQVRILGLPFQDISKYYYSGEEKCKTRQQLPLHLPGYLISEVEAATLKDLIVMLQLPVDEITDNKNISR